MKRARLWAIVASLSADVEELRAEVEELREVITDHAVDLADLRYGRTDG